MTTTRRIFLKSVGLGAAGLSVAAMLPSCQTAAALFGNRNLPRSTPEAEGVASDGILAFLDAMAAHQHELHSFMLVRHGRVVAEGWWAPYGPRLNHALYSLSKSFTSTAVGFAVTEGRFTVEDKVSSFFPKELPATVSDHLAALRVKHLLTMAVGNAKEPTFDVVQQENWVKAFLAAPITHPPGSTFMYNSAATYMCSAIVQQVTGQRVLDYLTPRLFAPLGIAGMTWETCPRGINTGGWGLSVPTEALAKFGQLYLQKGSWEDRRILPAQWVAEATTFKIQQPLPAQPARPNEQSDWLQGYCYQFWRCQHQAFRGDGAFGQFMIVMPEQDAVLAITGESKDLQGELDLVWEHLLPAMREQPLAADPQTQAHLRQRLATLALPPPNSSRPEVASHQAADRVSGQTFQLAPNALGLQSTAFTFRKDGCVVIFKDARASYPIACGLARWERGTTALPGTPPRLISGGAPKPGTQHKLVASGQWKDGHTFEMLWRYYETPHHDIVTCRFDADKLAIAFSGSLGANNRPMLQGKMA